MTQRSMEFAGARFTTTIIGALGMIFGTWYGRRTDVGTVVSIALGLMTFAVLAALFEFWRESRV